MAYYGKGKHSFKSVIDSINNLYAKEFLKHKAGQHYYEKKLENCWIEQMLYNDSATKLKYELSGFVAGWLKKDNQKYIDYDEVSAHIELMPILHKIWNEMNSKNKWDDKEGVEEWDDVL